MAIGWGSMDMIQGATVNYAGLLVLRILVGVFKAGFVPAVALYLSFFYHRREMGLRYGLFMSCAPLANGIASAIPCGVVHAGSSRLEHWQLIFLIGTCPVVPKYHNGAYKTNALVSEGAPTIILAAVAYFYLPNRPFECPLLDDRQNEIIGQRAVIARGNDHEKKINFKQAFAAFSDYKNYLQAAIILCLNTAFGSLPAYLPTILTDMGFSNTRAESFSAIPYLSACFFCVGISFASDYCQTRGLFISLFTLVGGAGYVILALVSTNAVRFFATFLVCAGVFPAVSLTFTWVTDNQGSSSKRGVGLAIFGMTGRCGPLLGARIFPSSEGSLYSRGMWGCAGVLFAVAILSLVLRQLLVLENRRRDRELGASDARYAPLDIADQGDEHPMHRFVL